MKKHIALILLCLLIMGSVITIEIMLFKNEESNISVTFILQTVFFVIWLGCLPVAAYSYYRMVFSIDWKNNRSDNHIVPLPSLLGLLCIPVFASPFLVVDYIKFLKQDLKKPSLEEEL